MGHVPGRRWLLVAGAVVLAFAVVRPPHLRASSNKSDDVARLRAAATVFRQVMSVPEKGIPREILENARCIAIIPGVKKLAFGVGGDYGKGVAICRNSAGTKWNPPLFITVGGGSWGWQIGVQSSDLVMVFPTRGQLNSLLSSKFRIGAEAAAAAGPVGRNAQAATDVKLNSEILTYGRSKGAFAGISISGAVVQPDTTGNQAMYGQNINTQNILSGNRARIPPSADPLIRALNTYSGLPPTRGQGTAPARRTAPKPQG